MPVASKSCAIAALSAVRVSLAIIGKERSYATSFAYCLLVACSATTYSTQSESRCPSTTSEHHRCGVAQTLALPGIRRSIAQYTVNVSLTYVFIYISRSAHNLQQTHRSAMSDASHLSDTDYSVGEENYVSSPSRDSSPFRNTSSLLGDLAFPHLEPAPLDAFPLMRLSPELRLNVYDQLLIYMLMSGEIGKVCWDKYDAAFGHGKQMIWDEWERRGFPDTSLTRADIILSQKAQLETCMAAVWMRKGDQPRDHELAVFIIEDVYCLGNWLRLCPSYAIG